MLSTLTFSFQHKPSTYTYRSAPTERLRAGDSSSIAARESGLFNRQAQNRVRTGQTSSGGFKGVRETEDQIEAACLDSEPSIGQFYIRLSVSYVAALRLRHGRKRRSSSYSGGATAWPLIIGFGNKAVTNREKNLHCSALVLLQAFDLFLIRVRPPCL